MKNKIALTVSICLVVLVNSCIPIKKYNQSVRENQFLLFKIDSFEVISNQKDIRIQKLKRDVDRFVRNSNFNSRSSLFASFNTNNNHSLKIQAGCGFDRSKLVSNIDEYIKKKMTSHPFLTVHQNTYRVSAHLKKSVYIHSGYSKILEDNPKYEEVIYVVTVYYDNDLDKISIHVDYLPMVSSTKEDNQLYVSSTDRLLKYSQSIDSLISTLYLSNVPIGCPYEKN